MAPRALLVAALAATGPAAGLRSQVPDLNAVRARADLGDAAALNTLGDAFLRGDGVPRDVAQAVRFYERAAALGHAPSMFSLATLFESEIGRAHV